MDEILKVLQATLEQRSLYASDTTYLWVPSNGNLMLFGIIQSWRAWQLNSRDTTAIVH